MEYATQPLPHNLNPHSGRYPKITSNPWRAQLNRAAQSPCPILCPLDIKIISKLCSVQLLIWQIKTRTGVTTDHTETVLFAATYWLAKLVQSCEIRTTCGQR
jgi:hypothetical protein